MRRNFLKKVAACLATTVSTIGLIAGMGQPSQAQTFPSLQFGCSTPSDNLREYPRGLGNAYNNALIATPETNTVPFPLQTDIAVLGGFGLANGGFFTGQQRCAQIATRLNAFNGDYGTTIDDTVYVFDVTYSEGPNPIICLQPIGTANCPNLTAVPIGGTITPDRAYTIATIVHSRNKGLAADQLVGNLSATAGAFRTSGNSMPVIDMPGY